MTTTPCSITVVPPTLPGTTTPQSVSVSITSDRAGASPVTAYTTENGSTAVTWPATVSATTTFWFAAEGGFYVSALTPSGQQVARDDYTVEFVPVRGAQGIARTVVCRQPTDAPTASGTALLADATFMSAVAESVADDPTVSSRFGRVRFVDDDASPIFEPTGGDTYATFIDVWYDAGTFYAAIHVDDGIELRSSPNGKTSWTSHGLILEPNGAGWDSSTVGVPSLWKEGSTWYLMYRGTGSKEAIGLATASAVTGPYTRTGANPIIEGTSGQWDASGAEGSAGQPIKVGSTYYVFYESATLNRAIGLATSTDLVNWTKDAANPIFVGGRFCPSVWKDGDWYYMAVARYSSTSDAADLEGWRCRTPTFYATERESLGIIRRRGDGGTWDAAELDTPVVLSDTINRDTRNVTNGEMWMYFAGQAESGFWSAGLAIGEPAPTPIYGHQQYRTMVGPWTYDDLATNKGSGFIFLCGGGAVHKLIPVTSACSVTGISVWSTGVRSAGTATAKVVDSAGNPLGLEAVLNATNTSYVTANTKPGTIQLAPGRAIGIALTSSGWAPTTADILVMVELTF